MAVGTRTIGRRPAALMTLLGIALYTLLVGADSPVVRAALTGLLSVIALRLGRQTEARTSLLFVAVVMTVINPNALSDVGFQLSLAATLFFTPVARREQPLRVLHQHGGDLLILDAVLPQTLDKVF